MAPSFQPEIIREQIAKLKADREQIDQAIAALEAALGHIEVRSGSQRQLFFHPINGNEMTVMDAVRRECTRMIDGISRQRVLAAIQRSYPSMKPADPSIAAALVNLSKGDDPMLKLAIEGRGRNPSIYSTQGAVTLKLLSGEIQELLDPSAIRGSGGWQSLWICMQKAFDKTNGEITLQPELRARIYHYYHTYGVGGWQNRVRRIFQRELPHLFETE